MKKLSELNSIKFEVLEPSARAHIGECAYCQTKAHTHNRVWFGQTNYDGITILLCNSCIEEMTKK